MKVVRLVAENIKRLIAVDIQPDGAVVQITGKNGAGKSSVLDSIWYALGGERNIPGEPVRKGEKKARVTLDLGDLIVERRWTEGGTSLVVTNKEGLRYSSPQKVLDTLCGRLTFDPLDFARQKPNEQAKTLARLVGLDLSEIDQRRAAVYDERRDVNRDLKRLEAECASLPTEPPEAADLAAAHRRLSEEREKERRAQSSAMALSSARLTVEKQREHFKACEAAVVEAKARLAESERALAAANDRLNEISSVAVETHDVEGALAAYEHAQRQEAARTAWESAQKQRQRLKDMQEESAALTKRLKTIDAEQQAKIAACTFPLPDLVIADEVVRYKGVPFDQCSSAEQLRVSTAIAMRMNPKLRIIRIADGSLLDSDSMAMLAELAAAEDYQVWVETVDSDDASAVVIADGRVVQAMTGEAA